MGEVTGLIERQVAEATEYEAEGGTLTKQERVLQGLFKRNMTIEEVVDIAQTTRKVIMYKIKKERQQIKRINREINKQKMQYQLRKVTNITWQVLKENLRTSMSQILLLHSKKVETSGNIVYPSLLFMLKQIYTVYKQALRSHYV